MPVEPEKSELVQSLERALKESRRIRERSSQLLEKAQWPLVEDPVEDPEAVLVGPGTDVGSGT